MLQQFTEKQVAEIAELFERGDSHYFYVASLRVFGHATTTAREPFCILAHNLPAPRIDEAWDEEARRRALHILWVNYLTEEDRKRFTKKPIDFIVGNDVVIDGESHGATPEFACRCVYYYSRFLFAQETLPHAWCMAMQDYLSERWPQYKGEPITQDVLEAWGAYCQHKDAKEVSRITKGFNRLRDRIRELRAYLKIKWVMYKHRPSKQGK